MELENESRIPHSENNCDVCFQQRHRPSSFQIHVFVAIAAAAHYSNDHALLLVRLIISTDRVKLACFPAQEGRHHGDKHPGTRAFDVSTRSAQRLTSGTHRVNLAAAHSKMFSRLRRKTVRSVRKVSLEARAQCRELNCSVQALKHSCF